MNHETPEIVKNALLHVKQFFPEVTHFLIMTDGRWLFMDNDGESPSFEFSDISITLIESVASTVQHTPAVFYMK